VPFYRDLMAFLGWETLYDGDGMLGVAGKNGESLWFAGGANDALNDYERAGMNHLGMGAASQADVDAVVMYLTERGIVRLFETPRHRSDFAASDDDTYYEVMFESPDRILFEVVYTGPKRP
jgi:catechol 2,3-dioxygenase-like lactoylglutathione lyase family enzyme